MSEQLQYAVRRYEVPNTNGATTVKVPYLVNVPDHVEEDNAMLCACLSRTPMPMERIIDKVVAQGSGPFIEKFYVGYNHASIGNCASCTLHVEGCSMLAAKALQSHQKYNGQECSTRYLDFAQQLFLTPFESPVTCDVDATSAIAKATEYVEQLRAFYIEVYEPTVQRVATKLGVDMSTASGVQANTVRSQAFDIVRGFLPAGCTTNVAIHLTLRDMEDHLQWLFNHELPEVREIAKTMHVALRERHPHTFKRELTQNFNWSFLPQSDEEKVTWVNAGNCPFRIEFAKTNIHNPDQSWNVIGPIVDVTTRLDFGCYRDLQRHTSVARSLVRLRPREFEDFYVDNLPPQFQDRAKALIQRARDLELEVAALLSHCTKPHDDEDRLALDEEIALFVQYFCPMGFKVTYSFRAMHSALAYIFPLRSANTVHPVLRRVVREIYHDLDGQLRKGGWPSNPYQIHQEATTVDFKRGAQTIELKK